MSTRIECSFVDRAVANAARYSLSIVSGIARSGLYVTGASNGWRAIHRHAHTTPVR
jgi:hypothetical protein